MHTGDDEESKQGTAKAPPTHNFATTVPSDPNESFIPVTVISHTGNHQCSIRRNEAVSDLKVRIFTQHMDVFPTAPIPLTEGQEPKHGFVAVSIPPCAIKISFAGVPLENSELFTDHDIESEAVFHTTSEEGFAIDLCLFAPRTNFKEPLLLHHVMVWPGEVFQQALSRVLGPTYSESDTAWFCNECQYRLGESDTAAKVELGKTVAENGMADGSVVSMVKPRDTSQANPMVIDFRNKILAAKETQGYAELLSFWQMMELEFNAEQASEAALDVFLDAAVAAKLDSMDANAKRDSCGVWIRFHAMIVDGDIRLGRP